MDFEAARQQMIDQQVRAWEVLDPRVLEVLARVPREQFVPPAFRQLAFADASIPLPEGESMLAPKIDGRILQAVGVSAGESVVEVGTGSGFLAACLGGLGGRVTTVERRPQLAELAGTHLRAAGFPGVAVVAADATAWQPPGRVDVVILSASLPVYDPRYAEWLTLGGRLFVAVGAVAPMTATLVTRAGEREFARLELFETVIDPLFNARRPSAFVF
jgi:protein-L-isoaspartate(D-aspartate) O-methyltransferase